MLTIILVVVWVVCGVLAYGITKGAFLRICDSSSHEPFYWFCAFVGPIGLIGAVIGTLALKYKLFFRYRAPK
jgi:hypothetical protein